MDNPSLIAFPSRPRLLGILVSIVLGGGCYYAYADDVQFNIDVLDVKDRNNIDLDQFSRGGYIMPGDYSMKVRINKQELPEQPITFYVPDNDPKGSEACITPAMVEQFAIKPALQDKLTWWHQGQCLVSTSLDGMTSRAELGTSTLYVSLPQAYLEYTSDNWDPPSRWDEGIPGLLVDYYLNAQTQRQQQEGSQGYNLSGNGTVGANLGAWRLRADWQTRVDHQTGSGESSQKKWDWSRYYAYRAIPSLGAKMTVGENYLYSDIFDSFRFAGASLISDDSMLPPNLRGYAPEVTGVARTNAKVVISQQGRVLYETQVAAGPFRIQDINDAVSGQLDVRVEELDGSVQEFKMDTASIPYLTRPGQVRYKVASGRPSDWQHRTNGPMFATGEFSWGVSNGWSLYGGGVAGGDYNALALGVGRDLMIFGALSFDVTQSRAQLPNEDQTLTGGSYRLSYSKRFDEMDSQVTFAGYRFSEQDFLSMSEYLDTRNFGTRSGSSKEMYTITFNQQLRDLGLSAYLNYSHQTYWDRPVNDRYNLTLSRNFDLGRFRNLSLSVTAYRNKYNNTNDDGMYLSLSVPWGNSGSLSYSGSYDRNDNSHQVGYYDRLENGDSYQINSGWARSGATASGYYSHQGDIAQVNANANYQDGRYSSLGMSLQGGATATLEGAALHRSSMIGGTRMLVDTDGVAGIPIRGYGGTSPSNRFGKAVVADVSSYYRNQVSIDLNTLPENAEATQSVVQATLTEGAIGYRRFAVIAGEKAMAVIRLADGSTPPFGATVLNAKKQEVGIVNDAGSVYLSGINPGELMTVHWSGKPQCQLTLPPQIPNSGTTDLLLPCVLIAQVAEAQTL
ncbi:outer membrane usher protein [Serratia proteamaculans]|jgi:outer membrane usher protein FimD/PapC|uniref:outer membrane usher protein n=1 Tax=Serratia proteamaculans TaxID=28151 RepID=UPI0021776C91|nr:outer membrane usher protein [Serratia proteamaculans]CAI0905729.1 Outer membrane usher protein papC precursor [Serratia proteamaculans]CAI0972229.1 Outer membrane usher protein papC precursor [Serratia proteamaculans]CAI1057036.1 Outer membrane usher protein papC precursor [Serratia proteamaculans]CAI2010664.1 Outer membrane usher protein papC precursor [Serratia proteamaculans]